MPELKTYVRKNRCLLMVRNGSEPRLMWTPATHTKEKGTKAQTEPAMGNAIAACGC